MDTATHRATPWRKVYFKFGVSQSELARLIGRHRSKISRAIRDDNGLISGRDQQAIMQAARQMNVSISPDDLTPGAAG